MAGVKTEAKGNGSAPMFVEFQDGVTKKIAAARLELLDSDGPLYVITLETGEEVDVRTAKDASVPAPRNSDDVRRCLRSLA